MVLGNADAAEYQFVTMQSWPMMKKLFTERRDGLKPRVLETLDEFTRGGLLGLVSSRIKQEWFGQSFPFMCQDGQGNASCDTRDLKTMMATFDVMWPGPNRLRDATV
jgi:hypothetical protein